MIQRRKALLTSAFLLMLAAAFIDNLRGSLIPLLHDHLELDFALAGAMLLTVAGISGGLFNSQLLNIERRTGVRGLIVFSVGLTVIMAILATQVRGPLSLGMMAIFLGGAITSMGTISNLLLLMASEGKIPSSDEASRTNPLNSLDVRSARRAKMMAGLHLMYGLGSLVAPAVATISVGRGWPWPSMFILPLAMLVPVMIMTLPMDEKHSGTSPGMNPPGLPPEATTHGIWHNVSGGEWFIVAIFLAYVTGEVLTSMWMPAFLIAHFGLSYENANQKAAGFFMVFSLARLGVLILMRDKFHKPFIYVPLFAAATAMIAATVISQPGQADSALVFLFPAAGMIGPFFPMMLARVCTIYNKSWQRLTVIILTTMQVALALSHLILGAVFDHLGAQRAYLIPPLLLLIAGVGAWVFLRKDPSLRSG
jgi:fucose permease